MTPLPDLLIHLERMMEQSTSLGPDWPWTIARDDLRTLLLAARRIQALEAVDANARDALVLLDSLPWDSSSELLAAKRQLIRDCIKSLLDAASSAQADRAEAERLTSANESLQRKAALLEEWLGNSNEQGDRNEVRADAAEARIQELEAANRWQSLATVQPGKVRVLCEHPTYSRRVFGGEAGPVLSSGKRAWYRTWSPDGQFPEGFRPIAWKPADTTELPADWEP